MEELRYMSDADIAAQYSNFEVNSLSVEKSEFGGYIGCVEVEFTLADEIDFDSLVCDNFIIYDDEAKKIAFDNWYPGEVYSKLCDIIRTKVKELKITRIRQLIRVSL